MRPPIGRASALALTLFVSSCARSFTLVSDAGSSVDAGVPGFDAGTHRPDAGAMPIDAGPASCDFPSRFDRSCTGEDDECVVGIHQIDCCGSAVVIGLNQTEQRAFNLLEMNCRAMYPDCDCAPSLTQTDSGETTHDPSLVRAACVSRGIRYVCLTYITERPADGR